MTVAAIALAVALLVAPMPAPSRARRGRAPLGTDVSTPDVSTPHPTDPLAGASSLDILAVCLTVGMPVAAAARATAGATTGPFTAILGRAADLLALGADPAIAWAPRSGEELDADCLALLRLARRSAVSGSALATGVAELAAQIRQEAAHRAEAAAEKASVVIAAPLGLCFLPAFICLGLVPVVAGLARDVFGSGLL